MNKEKIRKVWEKAQVVAYLDPNQWRKDCCGAWIHWDSYGTDGEYAWDIDHILPIAKGGMDHIENLQPMLKKNNKNKADHFPEFQGLYSSEGFKNVVKNQKIIIAQTIQKDLKKNYPNNKYIKLLKKN